MFTNTDLHPNHQNNPIRLAAKLIISMLHLIKYRDDIEGTRIFDDEATMRQSSSGYSNNN